VIADFLPRKSSPEPFAADRAWVREFWAAPTPAPLSAPPAP